MQSKYHDAPTAQLLEEMARHGLEPGDIIWDGRKHRFPGAGKRVGRDRWSVRVDTNAWYFAYPDRLGAHFGDFSTGCKVHWMFHRAAPFTGRESAFFRLERKRRYAQQKEVRRAALLNVRKVWKAAKKLDPKKRHPYLLNNEIMELPPNLRVSTATSITSPDVPNREEDVPAGLLLVPMFRRGSLVNLQRIYRTGKMRFFPGAALVVSRHIIGVSKETDWSLVYVCEGWATGWTIHQATNQPVVCAFTASNLRAVAKWIRKRYDPGEMRIAADNDRWSKIRQQGGDIQNVGVHYAREAAAATGSVVVIPDFLDLEGRPTDFNDLRQCEGDDEVEYWLDPKNTIQRPAEKPSTSQEWIQI